MAETKIVIGSLFGDEGKGTTVNWLCKQAIAQGKTCAVVRFCNGPQSGHTVLEKDIRHTFSSFGSGTILGVPTIYTKDTYVNPIVLMREYDALVSQGVKPVFDVSSASLITPYDVLSNQTDEKNLSDGTCGHGVYKTVLRVGQGIERRYGDTDDISMFLQQCREYYGFQTENDLEKEYMTAYKRMATVSTTITDTFDTLIYEGTQGLLLDAEKGYLPHVTATKTIPNLTQFSPDTEVYLVCRTYLTRHGNSGNTVQISPLTFPVKHDYTNVWNQFQGIFNKGLFDVNLLNEAFERHGLEKYDLQYNLVITHCDDVRENYCYKVNGHTIKGDLQAFVTDIQKCVTFKLKGIYTNSSEKSDLKIFQKY